MPYDVECKKCGTFIGSIPGSQNRGARLTDWTCSCGGQLRRIGWQEAYRRSGRLKMAADVAAEVLRETDNPAVGWGDSRLLHTIAERLGIPHEGHRTEQKVLDRIERSCAGVLEKRLFALPGRGRGRLRRFWLPDKLPDAANVAGKSADAPVDAGSQIP